MFQELRETDIETLDDLNTLVYTEKCLLECLRMGPVLMRGLRAYV